MGQSISSFNHLGFLNHPCIMCFFLMNPHSIIIHRGIKNKYMYEKCFKIRMWLYLYILYIWAWLKIEICFISLCLICVLLLLSHFRRVRLCVTPSLGFSRQEHRSGLPFPSPMHKSEKWKWSCSVVSDSSRPRGLQPTRLLRPWDFPGKSTGVGCHCLLHLICVPEVKYKVQAFLEITRIIILSPN